MNSVDTTVNPATPPTALRSHDLLRNVTDTCTDFIFQLGDLTLFTVQILKWFFRHKMRPGTLISACFQIGVLSLPVIALTGIFIGMVLAVQSHFQFSQIGMANHMGAVINMTLVRELGPVLAATMLAGRIGSAMAAELGTMRVTEQIEALESMGINPIHHLVLIPTLTIMADFMGIFGGFAYSYLALDIDPHLYFQHSRDFVSGWDLLTGLIKSLFFGCTIAIVSCYHGFHCQVGAKGVGRAATAAFVISFVLILGIDLILGMGLDRLFLPLQTGGNSLL